ncbi:hypothetical protein EDD32_3517 [Georgenia muralis]|uniref:Polymerase beta nucleotidyltransferase domain-containing protein n=2 Tax=Georgenia muralis TaxID=154117 RepID=A0A3N4ZAL1_9MICO|nr:hypothetical protein EDD32_3517 [Georgenia muralis]
MTRPSTVRAGPFHVVVRSYSDVMGSAARTLRRLRAAKDSGALTELCRRRSIELAVLFGSSVARAPVREPRDVDLALSFRRSGAGDLLTAIEDLAELVGGDDLDVMDLASAGPVALHRVFTTGELLYQAHPHLFAERQIFAINHYIETAPLRRSVLESLTR